MNEKISNLDFSLLKIKLMFEKNWSEEKASHVELKYKNFLYLHFKYQHQIKLIPTEDIDEFWHGHILDTKSYRKDTQEIFGKYLDHHPYGELDETGGVDHVVKSFHATMELYRQEFNEDY